MDSIIKEIKTRTGSAPDITYKEFPINNEVITLIYSNSTSNQSEINDFILRRLDEDKNNIKTKDLYNYIKDFIPNNNIIEVKDTNEALYYLLSGFTIIVFKNKKILALENKAKVYSSVDKSETEKSIKGPSDAFCENYQTNTGMIRRRIKTEDLWIKETIVGTKSKTKVGVFYIKGLCDEKVIKNIEDKINKIDIEYVGSSNYILESISNTNRLILPTNLTTERPDYAALMLMQGRVVILVENTNEVIILPCLFLDFFKNPEDYYEKGLNVFLNRIIRFIAFVLTVLTPAIYISLMAFNWESLPSGLLVNFSVQRDGVPFSTVFEIIFMGIVFQILRESDLKFPGRGGSSLSIVGALVLGQAAVEAGVVSPITIIIVGISAISSLCFSSIELINSIRYWQIFLIILASLFGFVGVLFGCLILLAVVVKNQSCGVPYFAPFEPFFKKAQGDAIILKKKYKFHPKKIFKEEKNDKENN